MFKHALSDEIEFPVYGREECPRCRGSGAVVTGSEMRFGAWIDVVVDCPHCFGLGTRKSEAAETRRGKVVGRGFFEDDEHVEVWYVVEGEGGGTHAVSESIPKGGERGRQDEESDAV